MFLLYSGLWHCTCYLFTIKHYKNKIKTLSLMLSNRVMTEVRGQRVLLMKSLFQCLVLPNLKAV